MPSPVPPPTLYLAISSHGYGHATRVASIAALVRRARPDVRLVFVTTAPRWLLEAYVPGDFDVRPRALDVGAVQPDSLTIDQAATLAAVGDYRAGFGEMVAEEAGLARGEGVALVLGDIPPAAPAIARLAGVPSWMVGNFAWDYIYRAWGGPFVEHADWIGDLYGGVNRLFRPPLHEPMSAFPRVVDIGLTGGTPRWPVEAVRARWRLDVPRERVALITFGGLGQGGIPYDRLASFGRWRFVTWDRYAPDVPNVRRIDDPRWRPVDLMPAAGRLVGKPGYSTYSEALREGLAIVAVPRPGFAEALVLVDGVRDHAAHQVVPLETLVAGDWGFLDAEPDPPRRRDRLRGDGSAEVARAVVAFLDPTAG